MRGKSTCDRLKVLGLMVCSLLFAVPVYSGHIIGGEITYRCLGGGDYEFTMRVYRDCHCLDCADFDEVASFGIYECGNAVNCAGLLQHNESRVNVRLSSRRQVTAPEYPCLETPPNLCVEEGIYRFRLRSHGISLPLSSESYFIVYQRCCRNVTINNLVNPEGSGATFFTEITPRAQRECNTSPEFKAFPPTVICARFPLEFDHGATDADGDSLAYRYCAPLLGGGRDGGPGSPLGSNAYGCTGVFPTPACPPPFQDVVFLSPFSAQQPLLGSPVVGIDQYTGMIRGTPEVIGQFVVGVCVDEYRGGELIGTLRRDFQFNTAGCDPTVFADIEADRVLGEQRYAIISCGSNTVTFNNLSQQARYIREYIWEFAEGNPAISNDRNATVTFPDTGTYVGKLILNPGLPCSDSADIVVSVFPEIKADFEFDYDTCTAGDVVFTDKSYSGSGQLTSWSWDLDQVTRRTVRHPVHTYREPGLYDIELLVTDRNSCRDSITRQLSYFPVPEEVVLEPSKTVGCDPAAVTFVNLSEPIDSTYDITWDFGDGTTGKGISPDHVYRSPGTYTVSVRIVSPIGCETSAVFADVIDVQPSPVANFSYTPAQLSSFNSRVSFLDASTDAVTWRWDFGGAGNSSFTNPVFTFPDTGFYAVQLIVSHASGCLDTIVRVLDVEPRVTYFLPNAFSPDGDGLNDEFRGTGVFDYMSDFSLSIFNRWGELLFETRDPMQGWNGSRSNMGERLPMGVYVCVVRYREARGKMVELKGFATLVD